MADRHGWASFLGLDFTRSAKYTISQGISPGVIYMTSHVQPQFPARVGDVFFTDEVESLVIPDCKLEQVIEERGDQGRYWEVRILDRRWKWLQLGAISGMYNQLDPHGKLIPWTIKSPKEMATLCLEAMKEVGYQIDMPEGLESGSIPESDFFLPGDFAPPTATNPPIEWYAVPPAQALQQLCDLFGRRIVYRLDTDTIWVVVPGSGAELPDGSIRAECPGIKSPPKTDIVAAIGSPTRFQVRLRMEAVGLEWDESWQPINSLSYAPIIDEAKQVTKLTFKNPPVNVLSIWTIFLNGYSFSKSFPAGTSLTTIVNYFVALINGCASTHIAPYVFAEATDPAGGILTLRGTQMGVPFVVKTDLALGGLATDPQPGFLAELIQAASEGRKSWAYCPPPLFPTVRATDRLTYQQAVDRARGCIWLTYRIVNLDASGEGTVEVPGYPEPIKRRQQLLLNETQVDQVVPEAIDKDFVGVDGKALVVNYYNGYSRDKPAAVFGSISRFAEHAVYIASQDIVTAKTDQVHVPFSIDPVFQLVIFSDYVYTILPVAQVINFPLLGQQVVEDGRIGEPELLLQTAVNIRDPETNQLLAFISAGPTPGAPTGTDALFRRFDDIQLNVRAEYQEDGSFKDVTILETDPINRAAHYVAGMQLQYPNTAALTRTYNGIKAIFLDGLTNQVTWTVGGAGPETQVSQNTEHDIWVPGYPARRRQERLQPVDSAGRLATDPSRINPAEPR